MQGNRFWLFPNHLRLPYSIPKSFALLLAFHCSRHTFAVLAIAKGVNLYTVSKLLGHQSISVTQIYTEVLDSAKEEAMKKIGELNV